VDDFERLLEETNGRRGVKACFGVIDADGGAAYFEAAQDNFARFDATDPGVAPDGYLLRTNYGFSGTEGAGNGYIRYDTLEELFAERQKRGDAFTPDFILLEATRCLRHSVLKTNLESGELPKTGDSPDYVTFRDYVVQYATASSLVVQGVKPGEDPALTTMWTIPAYPLTAVSVPTWVAAGDRLPEVVVASDGSPSVLTRDALALKETLFPLPGRDGRNYLNRAAVVNQQGDGSLQRVRAADREILDCTRALLTRWRASGFDKEEALSHYDWIDGRVRAFYAANPPPAPRRAGDGGPAPEMDP
jgi:hypothetical protein